MRNLWKLSIPVAIIGLLIISYIIEYDKATENLSEQEKEELSDLQRELCSLGPDDFVSFEENCSFSTYRIKVAHPYCEFELIGPGPMSNKNLKTRFWIPGRPTELVNAFKGLTAITKTNSPGHEQLGAWYFLQ